MAAPVDYDPFGLSGTTIEGKYRIASVVGDGGFGVVYRGVHKGFGELIAVKCLKLPGSLDEPRREALLEQLRDEGRLLHRLSRVTSGIVQALDVGAFTTAAGVWVPYLVLEWLEGRTLAEFMRERLDAGEGGLALDDALTLLEPAARALSMAHKQKVAHRDVKPANLFVTDVGGVRTVKVLDFGIAKVLTSTGSFTEALADTKLGPTAFTPRYGAPEQFNKQRGASGPWTDVFALGLIFVELVSGRKALEGDDPTQLYIAAADPAIRPTLRARGVSALEPVEQVLAKALSVEPKHRYADAGEFWDALVAAARSASAMRLASPAGVGPAAAAAPSEPATAEVARAASTGERIGLEPTIPVESIGVPSGPPSATARQARPGPGIAAPNGRAAPREGGGASARAFDAGDPMAETPLPARSSRAASGEVRLGSQPSQADERREPRERTLRSDAGAIMRPDAAIPQPAARRSLVWPFIGGVLVFGCAYFAYVMLTSPEGRGSKSGRAAASALASANRSRAGDALDAGAAPGTSSSAAAPPPTPPEGMVYVAPATFKMGEGDEARQVTLTRGFFFDKDEVTVRAYVECVSKRLCTGANRVAIGPLLVPDRDPGDDGAGGAAPSDPPQRGGPLQPNEFIDTWTRACNEPRKASDHPINCVDYDSAASYCRFRQRRLPTEAEWELAARGVAARPYSWGTMAPDCSRACIDRNGYCRPAGENVATCTVHKHAGDATPEGVLGLGGNVSEWVADGFGPKPKGGSDPVGDPGAPLRVVRGGNFVDGPERTRATWRAGLSPNTALATVGFRCAMDADGAALKK